MDAVYVGRVLTGLESECAKGMVNRHTFFPHLLLQNLRSTGVVFRTPTGVVPLGVDDVSLRAIALLRSSPNSLPTIVLSEVCANCDETTLRLALSRHDSIVAEVDGEWRCVELAAPVEHPEMHVLLGEGIRSVLKYIRSNREHSHIFHQVDNVIALADLCVTTNPTAVASVFGPLDKLLKRRGRKFDVLQLAELTIRAARSINPPTTELVEAEAKALVCGRTWTYQRLNRLEHAALYAQESFERGDSIGYDRNTAFVQKCRGRLHRVQAEQAMNPALRRPLLKVSIELLKDAIERFGKLEQFGPEHEEVGDCYSLLGRTHLEAGNVLLGSECAEKARTLLTDMNSKDYLDLLILEGDIAAARLDFTLADAKYLEASELVGCDDSEKSEIGARALLRRGLNAEKAGRDKASAECDLIAARDIWKDCGDYYWAASAELARLKLVAPLPRDVERQIMKIAPNVAVHLIRRWRQATATQSSTTLAQRSELTEIAWKKLVRAAKEDDALRHRHWGEVFG